MSPDDTTLLERWTRQHDAEAFNAIVDRFADQVYATCRRILRNDADAEDVAQECFLHLVRAGGDVRASLGGWLHRVATSKSLDRIRRDASRRAREGAYADVTDATGVPVDAGWDEIQRHVDEAIEALPEETRDAIVAHFLGRKSHAEIAAELRVGRRAVSYRIERGVAAIRRELSRRGVSLSAAALVPLLAVEATAAPLSLKATLGKLAIAAGTASGGGGATAGGSLLGSLILMKTKSLLVAGILIAVAAGLYFAMTRAANKPPDWGHVPVTADSSGALEDVANSIVAPAPKSPLHITPAAETPTLADLLALSRSELERELERYPFITAPSQYASVSGVVIDGNGYPVPDTSIALVPTHAWGKLPGSSDIARTAASDVDGIYRIDDIKRPGDFRVVATKHGFISEQQFTLVEAGKNATVDFTLEGGLSIQGRVVSASGEPVPDAYLYCIGLTGQRRLDHDLTRATQTDGEGYFSFGVKEEQRGFVAVFRVQSAKYGERTFADILVQSDRMIELRLEAPAVVHGTVKDSSGKPLSGALLTFFAQKTIDITRDDGDVWASPSFAGSFTAICDGSGRYATEVDTGLDLLANVEVHGFDDGRESMPKIAALGPGETREYNAVFDTDTIAVRATFVGQLSGRPFSRYIPVDAFAIYEGKVVAKAQPDGHFAARFTLPGAKGTYSFQARYMYDDDIAGNISAPYELKSGDDIEIELDLPDPQSFAVRTVDPGGNPVEGAAIRFLTETWGGDAIGYGQTNAEGRLDEPILVAPLSGAQLVVEMPGYAPAFGPTYPDQSPGTVHPEDTIVLWPGAGFEGVLLDREGNPRANTAVSVSVTNPDGQTWPIQVTTDAGGHFTVVDQAPADVVDITISSGDGDTFMSTVQGLHLEADSITDLGVIVPH